MEIVSGPITSCSKEQQKIYQQWFAAADSDGDGRITGNDATKFFSMSNLSRAELKQVWALADAKRQGYLGFREFVAAMQLISFAQAGQELAPDLLGSAVNVEDIKLPVMEGLDTVLAKKKKSITRVEPELNGSSRHQSSPSSNWFGSKLSKKVTPQSLAKAAKPLTLSFLFC